MSRDQDSVKMSASPVAQHHAAKVTTKASSGTPEAWSLSNDILSFSSVGRTHVVGYASEASEEDQTLHSGEETTCAKRAMVPAIDTQALGCLFPLFDNPSNRCMMTEASFK
ncbi:hypothetical protein COCCADRAFT_86263 [Bipolaris zeicola 26-R-13]|uniref:Uncharacterized protein n=1 Tax=Cochliobolus carbonum (strain 26-R-13) TaxID=930089 RepID=W6YC38_COCC2|nr:uncharacterized protein COCCADRAFT_86263 [Bipolaris zeicola 26-R-13]EUC37152.1 hypothetical protein COCCADRAFT_86263 [Bipolaris zeicola 26-R-13]